MAYSDTPLSTEAKRISQPKIKENFVGIKDIISVDHVDFGTGNSGKHQQVTFTEQVAHPETAEDEIKLYCKKNGAIEALWIQPADQIAGHAGFDISTLSITVDANETKLVTLPSGVRLYWLKWTMNAAETNKDLDMGTAFNIFSSLFFTPLNNSAVNYSVTKNTVNNFTIHRSASAVATTADILLMGF